MNKVFLKEKLSVVFFILKYHNMKTRISLLFPHEKVPFLAVRKGLRIDNNREPLTDQKFNISVTTYLIFKSNINQLKAHIPPKGHDVCAYKISNIFLNS